MPPEKKAEFGAYSTPESGSKLTKSTSFKVTLVLLDCIFLGLQPVLVHLSKNAQGTYSFNPVTVNFLTEITKTSFALVTLLLLGTGRPGPPMYKSARSFIADAHHNRLLFVPAGLYAINNYLKFAMQLFFRPTTTKMLGNLKVFTIAVLLRVVMKRQFNIYQIEALFLLVAGITINQLQNCAPHAFDLGGVNILPAAICTLGTVTVPSAASVYNELALKKHMDTSVHLQNFFLYFYGACFNLLFLAVELIYKGQSVSDLFVGQSYVTYMLIANNACQGILSSFFFKYADTILKKYSSTVATIFTAVVSFAMFGHELSVNFFIGVSIVMVSMHQFFSMVDPKVKVDSSQSPVGPKMIYSPSLDHVGLEKTQEAMNEFKRALLPN